MVGFMPTIPPDIIPQLTELGIEDPAGNRWERREEWPSRYIRAHYFCPCGKHPGEQKVELAHSWLGGRSVFIGQCRWCKVVYWRDAVKE